MNRGISTKFNNVGGIECNTLCYLDCIENFSGANF